MRNVPHRGAPLYFALTFLTSGFFGLVWVYLMNRDIQGVSPSHTPNLRRIALLAFFYPVSVTAYMYADSHGASSVVLYAIRAVVLVSWVGVVWLLFGGLLSVARYLREQREQLPGNVALVVLTFVFFLSLPLLQRRLNLLALRNREGSVTPNAVPNA